MHRSTRPAVAVAVALALASASVRADPQWNVAIQTGLGGTGRGSDYWDDTCWYNALRADILFGRERNADIGIGPYAELSTAGFGDARPGAGLSLQLPVTEYVPIVLSGGGYARRADGEWEPGVAGQLFVGSRSYNYHSSYIITGGLVLGLHKGLGDSDENMVIVAAQIDSTAIVLPLILLYEWIRGPRD